MHHHQTHPVRHHVVHLPRDPRPLLTPRPLRTLLGPLREQLKLPLQTVRPLPQTLHQPPPRPHVQTQQHRRSRHPQRHRHRRERHQPVTDLHVPPRDVLPQPHEHHDQHTDRLHPRQRPDDPPRQIRRRQRIQTHDPQQEPHRRRRHRDRHQHHRDRPTAPHQQHRPRHQPEHHPHGDRDPRLPRERDPLHRTLQRGHHRQPHIEHGTAPPLPPPGPAPGRHMVFPVVVMPPA